VCLHHGDAELLDRRRDQGATASVELDQAAVAHATEKRGSCKALSKAGQLRAVSDDLHPHSCALRGRQRQPGVLVARELADEKEEVLSSGNAVEPLDVDGRMDDACLAPIEIRVS
jgi:hypothetical protein